MKKNLIRLGDFYLLFFLGFSPWYDLVHRLPSIHLEGSFLSQLTIHGLANVMLTSCAILALLFSLIGSITLKRIQRTELIILFWPILNILNIRVFDAPGLVTLYNAVFLSLCLLSFGRADFIFAQFKNLCRLGFSVLLISYSAALFLPFIIPLKDFPLFILIGDTERYCGWSGIGSISFGGVTIYAWGLMNYFFQGKENKKLYLNLWAMGTGILGVTLTVLRIGWIAIVAMLVFTFLGVAKKPNPKRFLGLCVIALLLVGSYYFSSLSRKAGLKDFSFKYIYEINAAEFLENATLLLKNRLHRIPSIKENTPVEERTQSETGTQTAAVLPSPIEDFSPKSTPTIPNEISIIQEKEDQLVSSQKNPQSRLGEFLKTYLYRFDGISNGRVGIIYVLLPELHNNLFLGLGTGGAGRFLRSISYRTLEAHNEYLRFFVDHGFVGMIIFMMVFFFIIKKYGGTIYFTVLVGLGILMLTDNVLIYPCFGYGPLFLAMCIMRSRQAASEVG